MLQVYHTQVHIRWPGRRFINRFHWLANNTVGDHVYKVSREINDELIFGTQWFHFLTLLVSDHARFRHVATRCVTPPGGPRAIHIFPGGGILGGWPFECPNNFETVEMQWMSDAVAWGKNHNRIGPLGSGATGDGAWNPLFRVACTVFGFTHGTPMTTAGGVSFRSCNVDKLGIAEPIIGQQIVWPPSRQKNRRGEL